MGETLDRIEEDVQKSPKNLVSWLQLISFYTEKGLEPITDTISSFTEKLDLFNEINTAYQRALRQLPYSFKLWFEYIKCREKQLDIIAGRVKYFSQCKNSAFTTNI
eukprot:Tbor_TRINITY_DN4545_c0_g1::TRINITY_DN4545_c0_g1_i1::g.15802::m.15802